MKFTSFQLKILTFSKMCNINYRIMYKTQRELGYTSKGLKGKFEINIAEDAPSPEIQLIVLLHELGHIYLGHVNKNINNEIQTINHLLVDNNISIDLFCSYYKGFMHFINLCMDLEVNSKILTILNIKKINNFFKIYTPSIFNIEPLNSYSEYYEPLIKKIVNSNLKNQNKNLENIEKIPQDLPIRGCTEQLSKNLQDVLEKENYIEGNIKAENNNKIKVSTVETFIKKLNKIVLNNDVPPEEKIVDFLKNIIRIQNSYKIDYIKQYNRKARPFENNILYSSKKLKHNYCNSKLGIIIDVSSSMDTSFILKALFSLKNYLSYLNKDSLLITWNDHLVNSFSISKIPNSLEVGGCTDMSSAINYLYLKDFKNIIVYSDFETPLKKLYKEILTTSNKINLYTIIINNENFRNFLKENFKKVNTLLI